MTRHRYLTSVALLAIVAPLIAGACVERRSLAPVDELWSRLAALCGKAYQGTVVQAPAGDTTFANRSLVMHVRECNDSSVLVPFHVGDNRSRTWVLTRTARGIRLKHDHRHEDGMPDSITQYGGDSRLVVTPARVEFPADSQTRELIPAAAANVWTVEIDTAHFVYALRREGTDRRFRIEFDLTRPVSAPPPPWGKDRAP